MQIRFHRLLIFILLTASIASCKIKSEVMFKPPKEYQFSELAIDTSSAEYTIRPYDVISFAVYTNEGAAILESSTGPADARLGILSDFIELNVNSIGEVEFPVVGNVKIDGLTVRQAQDKVEDIFETMFNRPYVILRVQNRQVVIFTSPDGNGKVVKLGEQYVSIVDALALAGGIGPYAEAYEIMLFRKVDGKTESYLIDLSKIEGIKYASAPVESGDVIYVQSRPRIPQKLAEEVRPILILFTGTSIVLSILTLLR
jgi:polysaccharide export outer membrane protein